MSAGYVSTFRTCVQVYLEIYLLSSCFSPIFDFVSIENFSAIATDNRHPLRSRSIYHSAAFCVAILQYWHVAFGCIKYNSFLVRLDICGEQTDRICLVYSLLDVLYDNSFMHYVG